MTPYTADGGQQSTTRAHGPRGGRRTLRVLLHLAGWGALLACGGGLRPPSVVGDPPPYTLTDVTLLTDDGGRVAWSPDGSQIAFDRLGDDGNWDLWLMAADATGVECLTCDHVDVARGNNGQPAWHPDGDWLVFQSESPEHPVDAMPTHPGAGVYNDLVAMRLSDRAAFVVHDVADGGGDTKGGALHAVFSKAGDRLLWTDYQRSCWTCPVGDWQIAIADWVVHAGRPALAGRDNHEPGLDLKWYETHGWGPDDSWILFSAATEGQSFLSSDLVRMDLDGAPAYTRITQTAGSGVGEYSAYDEHGQLSPGADALLWLNDEGGKAEYWLARPDGSGRFQLTTFNDADSAHGALVDGLYSVPSDNSWNPAAPEGTAQVAAFVQVDFDITANAAKENRIYLLDFDVAP